MYIAGALQIALFVSSPAGLQSSFISETHTVFSKILIASTSPGSTGIVRPSVTYNTYSTQDTLGQLEFAANNVCLTAIYITISVYCYI